MNESTVSGNAESNVAALMPMEGAVIDAVL
jgi:hypothetical protein